ncbi:MAG: ArnT family glycosyltransferase, partial [Candidatus Binatia bacterium]
IQEPAARLHIRFRTLAAGLLLFGALAFLRLYRLEQYPPNLHLDMAQWTVHVFRLLDGQPSTILSHGFAEVPLLGHLWSALWTAIAGRSLAGARFASVVGSLLAIAGVFFLVRRLYSPWVALVAVVLLGVNHGFLHFSRIQAYMDPIPFHVLGILGLVAGLESGRYGWFALAGLAGGYSALTYHAGRITPPIMMMLGALILLRYPRVILKRWPGLVLCAVALLGIVGPQAILYGTGRLNALGRREVYPFIVSGHVNPSLLWQTVSHGLPRVLGAFWFYGDTSTQYGSAWPVFFPPAAALLGMAAVAAVLRPWDIRGLWVVLWGFVILFAGGVLTIDPPFWPRFVTAFVPAAIAAAVTIGWLTRGATVAAGRVGRVIAVVSTCALLGLTSWQQLDAYRKYCAGIPPNESKARYATQWVQGIMGRDVQRWGRDAMMYIVAANPNWYSCRHPTIEYYAYDADVQDARDVTQYLPFKDPRTIVCYFLPGRSDQMAAVRRMYPRAEKRAFSNNVGQHIFTRVVIRAPHARTASRSGGLPAGP